MRNRAVIVSVGAAVLAAVLAAWWSPVLWKLASQTLVFADAAGFRELAAPGPFSYPGGALSWPARLLAATGLTAWGWAPYAFGSFLASLLLAALFPRTARGGGAVLLALPAFILLAPPLLAGTTIWLLPDSSMGWANLLGLSLAATLAAAGRRLRGAWSLLLAPVGILGAVPCGVYAPLGALLAMLSAAGPSRPADRWGLRLAALAQFALALPLVGALFYADLAPSNAWIYGGALFAHVRFSALNVANLLCVAALTGMALAEAAQARGWKGWTASFPRAARFAGPALLLVAAGGLAAAAACRLDLRPQFRVERMGVARDWAGVVAYEETRDEPMRMEVAWRILALHRLDRLPQDLLERPVLSFHGTTPAEEYHMDGFELLFGWGLLNPARRWVHQMIPEKDWQPRHLQLLGDRAVLTGEWPLAERKFQQLARCPFLSAYAADRLAFLRAHRPGEVPDDLRGLARDARALGRDDLAEERVFFNSLNNPESLVYRRYAELVNCPAELAPARLAAILLDRRLQVLARNPRLVAALYPDGRMPAVVRQALVVATGRPDPERDAFHAALRSVTDQDAFVARWSKTYYFYEELVK